MKMTIETATTATNDEEERPLHSVGERLQPRHWPREPRLRHNGIDDIRHNGLPSSDAMEDGDTARKAAIPDSAPTRIDCAKI
jgi:hypothetical protein